MPVSGVLDLVELFELNRRRGRLPRRRDRAYMPSGEWDDWNDLPSDPGDAAEHDGWNGE